jgi:hypothetical protein
MPAHRLTDRPAIPVSMMLLAIGATMRVTRLVTKDYLTDEPRRWVQRRAPEKIAYLVGCPWCTSFWVGGAIAAATARWPRSRAVVALWLALTASHASGMLGNLDPPEDFGEPSDDDPGE